MIFKVVSVTVVQTDGSTSLLRAARSGNVERVVELLAAGKIDINTCNAVGNHTVVMSTLTL